jgi:DNA-binding beta-propeller fold protein YncE
MLKTILIAVSLTAAGLVCPAASLGGEPYALAKTLHIGGDGGWDYVAVDSRSKLLYLPRSNHTMVVNETDGKLVADMPGMQGVHGVALVPQIGRGFISDGGESSVVVFDLKTNRVLGKVPAARDADAIIYDPASNRVLAACGTAGVLVPIRPDVDPKTGKADEPVRLDGEPEYLASDGHGRVYVNITDKAMVDVIDTHKMTIIDRWPTAPGSRPSALAIDPVAGNLFIGCRNQHLIVMSTRDGHVVADLPIGPGVDACAFDPTSNDVFASCGDGRLYIMHRSADGK